jgi:hypothetical protein
MAPDRRADMIALTPEKPIADLAAGSYWARVARSYGSTAGRCRIGTPEKPLATLNVGGKGRAAESLFDHPGGAIGIVTDEGVRAVVELRRAG